MLDNHYSYPLKDYWSLVVYDYWINKYEKYCRPLFRFHKIIGHIQYTPRIMRLIVIRDQGHFY